MVKQFFKKVLISYLIIICCIFTPAYRAYAVSAGGWSFSAFDVATSVVTAVKNGGTAAVTVAKSPISQKIGKGILGGVIAGAAIPLAISQISGLALDAIDWLYDPANTAIKWKPKDGVSVGHYAVGSYTGSTAQEACEKWLATQLYQGNPKPSVKAESGYCKMYGGEYNYNGNIGTTYKFVEDPNRDWRTIPIPTVADKIYDNAKTDTASAAVVNNAVKDYVNAGSADTALDAAKAQADATHGCGTGTHWSGSACVADTPSTPGTPTTPDTPFDPSSIIDAIKGVFDAVIHLPDVINHALDKLLLDIKDFFKPVITKVTDMIDWVKTEYDEFVKPADDAPTQLDIPNNVPTPTDTNIRFGGMCPPNADINVRIPFASLNFTLFDWSKWCYNLETFVKPVIILLAAYFSVLIFRGKNESS